MTTDPFLPRPFVVRRHRQDTRDTYTLVLERVDGAPMAFAAGQFTMMHAFGAGEAPISIAGANTSASDIVPKRSSADR